MKNLWRAYAILGVMTVVLLSLSPAKSYFSEWRHYQKKFNQLTSELPIRVPSVEIGLQQIWIEDADRIDRCVSCHVGLDNPNLYDMPQPFSSHPEVPHDYHEYGCTVCHQGQGLATNYKASIGMVQHWDQQVFPKKYLEAGCGRCHKQTEVPLSPVLSKGRDLMKAYNCTSCHTLPYIEKSYVAPLDGIGKRMSRSQLYRWLHEPQVVKPGTHMPDFQLSTKQAADLSDYLLTFTKLRDGSILPSLPDKLSEAVENEAAIKNGGKLFREARCISCHQIEGRGGIIAEEIGTAGTRYTAIWIYNYLADPEGLLPGVLMPRYGFDPEQLIDLTAYILSELQDWEFDPDEFDLPKVRPGFFERGEGLWTTFNCTGCHSLNGAPTEGELGPSLIEIGVKPAYSFEMGKREDLTHDLPVYLDAKITQPRSFLNNLRMPQYSFNEKEVDAIVTALLSFGKENELPEHWLVLPEKSNPPDLNGSIGRLFNRYTCLTCHALRGYGGDMAPELEAIGSQLSATWIKDYLHIPFSRRPILTERMPNLFISDAEVDTLINFVNLILVDDELDILTAPNFDAGRVEQGRVLFTEKFSCIACHQVSGKGGYVGPPLDGAGMRLKPGWIKAWLIDPQRWRPGTIEPQIKASDEEISAITAYLMTL